MKVTSLIDNAGGPGMQVEHGLSLYVCRENGQRVLFDMGQGALFARNAEALALSIADADVAVISHGHYDHGGGLRTFLAENGRARVYVHRDAFQPHYSLRDTGLMYIGLDGALKDSDRLVLCDDIVRIGDGMILFANVGGDCCNPVGNRLLFGPEENVNDTFCHEQSLVVEEYGRVVLFAGCAHRGIVNIIRRAQQLTGKTPTHVFAGMHLVKSGLSEADDNAFIRTLATELMKYGNTMFYTMHCTGLEQFEKLKSYMGPQITYMSCGDTLEV